MIAGENPPLKRNYVLKGYLSDKRYVTYEKARGDVLGLDLPQQVLLESTRSGDYIAPQRVILGLEPYLSEGFATFEESTVCDIQKPPGHKWKRPSFPNSSKKRGLVSGFSKKSRNRLMKKLAECKKTEGALFVTLTTPFDMPVEEIKESLWAFYKRLDRIYANISMVWKLEPHKSGEWHFHLILFGIKYLPAKKAKWMWADIIGSFGYRGAFDRGVHLKFIQAGDVTGIRNYMMKYMSKECDMVDYGRWSGRVWGSRGVLPRGERIVEGLTRRESIWLWRMICRKRKVNIVKMNTTFFSEEPEKWLENARIVCRLNASC